MFLHDIEAFLDAYNLPWLLLAIICWLFIFLAFSLKEFLYSLPFGIWTMIVGTILEAFFIHHKFWSEDFILIPFYNIDLFVSIGPFFTIGLVLIRFLPYSQLGKYLIIILLSILSTIIEIISIKLGFLSYHPIKWGFEYSIIAYILSLFSTIGFYYIYYNNLDIDN